MEVRTRFAPSPTGYMHIGNLRSGLYAYLFARANGGKFLLRIEDTDQDRYVEGAVDIIYNTLKDVGITWDEGPDVGGDFGPYVQSERKSMYLPYAEQLIASGAAYRCFCTREELDARRAEAAARGETFKYDKHCLHMSQAETDAKLAAGVPYVIRQNVPQTGQTSFTDLIFGTITVDNTELDDNVLIKADGMPTYNFANVIDDHLMKISHVMRGMEYLSSTPKYNLLYEAFGWEIPQYIHMTPIMRDAQHKLSKRDGDASYEDFVQKGYLKEAIVNYIALLGWSPAGEREIFTLEELTHEFSVSGMSKSPAVFDPEKLRWMNAQYIRALSPEQFCDAAMPWYECAGVAEMDTALISRCIQQRTEVLCEIPEKLTWLCAMPEFDPSLYANKKMKTDVSTALPCLTAAYDCLAALTDWSEASVHDALMALPAELGVKNGYFLWPLRIAITGTQVTPCGATEAAALLGRDETLARLNKSMEKLK